MPRKKNVNHGRAVPKKRKNDQRGEKNECLPSNHISLPFGKKKRGENARAGVPGKNKKSLARLFDQEGEGRRGLRDMVGRKERGVFVHAKDKHRLCGEKKRSTVSPRKRKTRRKKKKKSKTKSGNGELDQTADLVHRKGGTLCESSTTQGKGKGKGPLTPLTRPPPPPRGIADRDLEKKKKKKNGGVRGGKGGDKPKRSETSLSQERQR